MRDRTVTSGWLKLHVGCGGQVVRRENPTLPDARSFNYDYSYWCLECRDEFVEESIVFIGPEDRPDEFSMRDVRELPAKDLRELSIPENEDELAEQREFLASKLRSAGGQR